jgi:hypothetical protein
VRVAGGEPYHLELAALADHTLVVAEQGRVVLLRRLVEECALRGVSAVVLDWGGEFARLGEPWPGSPPRWAPGDEEAARQLLGGTEIVVWTPGLESGRPLFFPALPDFGALHSDPDATRVAVDMAVGALAPWATVDGDDQTILRDALTRLAERGAAGGLRALVEGLAASPGGAPIAGALTDAMASDPLLDGGMPVDPGILFAPSPRRRARVCVVSLLGLGSPLRQQTFVGQLQMAIYGWLQRHPTGERRLRGLLVMDEAQMLVPSGGSTACVASTLALVGPARRHGLGLVFGTQDPRGVHDRIAAYAGVQFVGLPTAGVFEIAAAGRPFEEVATPMCLTHHPVAPLTPEEVVDRANTYPGQ